MDEVQQDAKGTFASDHPALQLDNSRSSTTKPKGSLLKMASSLSIQGSTHHSVQESTLRVEARYPSPIATKTSMTGKSDVTDAAGSVADALTLVDEAVSNVEGHLIQVTPTPTNMPYDMQSEMDKAVEMTLNGNRVTQQEVKRMTEFDPESRWEKQLLERLEFNQRLMKLGMIALLLMTIGGGVSIWANSPSMRRQDAEQRKW